MGNGVVIDLKHLHGEMGRLREAGIKITPENLKISDRAIICMPYHVQQDCLEEVDENELSNNIELLNNRPRKWLGYKTPNEVMNSH